jgi:hypothetical protein
MFWKQIPVVHKCCSVPGIFDNPWAVHAYAYVHLLERYRRTWAALKYLSGVAVLPLGINGVRTLDIGAGPAPALFAIADFYQALNQYAREANIPDLQLPDPELNCIERSQPMVAFFHHFAEFTGRAGPFSPVFSDFAGLNLRELRAWNRRQNEFETYWDPETQQYEDMFNSSAAAESDRLFRYRMVVLSNFLTLESEVENFREELRRLFQDLRAGAVVIILGGTGDSYQKIYKSLAQLAREEDLTEAGWHTDSLGRIDYADAAARTIKLAQNRVYLRLEQLVGSKALEKTKGWPDYWNPNPSPKTRRQFALHIFRRGRWPKRPGIKRGNP